jgi:hypothetical protein
MIGTKQSSGRVVMVEFPDSVDLWEFPLTVSSATKGYVNDLRSGTKLDWRSSLTHLPKLDPDDEFLREV